MNSCEQWAALLDAFVDGQLSCDEAQQVRLHLIDCPRCQEYVAHVLAIKDAFPTVDEEPVPPGFARAVMARIEKTASPKKKSVHWKGFALPAVACLALVVSGKWLGATDQSASVSAGSMSSVAVSESAPMEESAVQATMAMDMAPRATEAVADQEIYAQQAFVTQAQVGDLLEAYVPVTLDENTLAYVVPSEVFAQVLSQIAGDVPVEAGESPTTDLCRLVVDVAS